MPTLSTWFKNTFSLLYPELCLLCGTQVRGGDSVCLGCEARLPETGHYEMKENTFTDIFYGRLKLEFGGAMFLFGGGSKTQDLIHAIKYQNKKELGIYLGRIYGKQLSESSNFPKIDAIIPVPLHPRKLYRRGYNQSELFGKGLSESLEVPQITDLILRNKMTSTQTKMNRMERMRNVEDAFAISKPERLNEAHILIVDDVITTGATLESCARKLLEAIPNVKISMATMAIGD